MGAREWSRVFLSDPECSSSCFIEKRKFLFFSMTSFQYFGNILVKIVKNNNKFDGFKIYTERAVEKVQDETFRCFGGREINKTKV